MCATPFCCPCSFVPNCLHFPKQQNLLSHICSVHANPFYRAKSFLRVTVAQGPKTPASMYMGRGSGASSNFVQGHLRRLESPLKYLRGGSRRPFTPPPPNEAGGLKNVEEVRAQTFKLKPPPVVTPGRTGLRHDRFSGGVGR